MGSYLYRTCASENDREESIDLYFAAKDELYLPDRESVGNMVDLIFARGGLTGGYHHGKLVGVLGYFFGDPARDHNNKEVLFLYAAAILPEYRGSRVFNGGLTYTLRQMQRTQVTEIRLQADITSSFTNRLYSRFARPLGRGKTLRGKDVITYGASLEDALAALTRPRRMPTGSYNQAPDHGSAFSR